MKKTLSLILLLSIFSICFIGSVSSSFAEESFSVRGGVDFGMSLEEVQDIEEKNGFTTSSTDDRKYLFVKSISLAGFDNGSISYNFGSDNSLSYFDYYWKDRYDDSSSNNTFDRYDDSDIWQKYEEQYKSLSEALSNKYETIGGMKSSDKFDYIDLNTNDEGGLMYYPFGVPSQVGFDYIGFNQFLVKSNDEYVEIVIMCVRSQEYGMFGKFERPSYISYDLEIRYRNRSAEQIDKLINNAKDKERQKESDL